ncbi:MAG: YraN family protein [Clostridia bacterium]|nr:YraN family protein [Clostridia bacterium]
MSETADKRAYAAALGREGEQRVAEYLKQQGYIIVKRNYRDRFGEVDIIAETRDTLVFVEVKTRAAGALVSGFEAVDTHKQRRLYKTGMLFLERLHRDLQPRFDVAEVTVETNRDGSSRWKLQYLKNAF